MNIVLREIILNCEKNQPKIPLCSHSGNIFRGEICDDCGGNPNCKQYSPLNQKINYKTKTQKTN